MESCSLYVLLNTNNNHQKGGCAVSLRISVNGEQQDFCAQPITGLQETYMVKTQIPSSSRVNLTQLEGCGDDRVRTKSHTVDVDSDLLLHMSGDEEPNKLQLNPGKQLLFILQSPWENTAVGIRGSMYELGKWTQEPHNQATLHIPSIGSLVAVPVESKDEMIEFNMVRQSEDGKEWESSPRSTSTAELSASSDTQVLVSSWDNPTVHKTDIVLSMSPEDFPKETRPPKPDEPEKVVTITDIVGDNKVPHRKANNSVAPSREPVQNNSISSVAESPKDTPAHPPAATEVTLHVPKQNTSQGDSSDDDTTCSKMSGTGDQTKEARSHAWSIFRAHNRKKFRVLQRRITDRHLHTFTTPLDKDDDEGEGLEQDKNVL